MISVSERPICVLTSLYHINKRKRSASLGKSKGNV